MPLALFLAAAVLSSTILLAQGGHGDVSEPYVPPPSNASALNDPVTHLARRIRAGQARLSFDDRQGFLASLLRELRVPTSSQVLVFSKTSLQHESITPRTPRALYFNDDVYVGFVPDGNVVELSAVDPRIGAVFYTLPQTRGANLRLVTNVECVQCHSAPATLGVSGHLLRSVFVTADGRLVPRVTSFLTDHRSPIEERWGGWYVTGSVANHTHMGNAFLRTGEDDQTFDRAPGTAITNVARRFDSGRYLSSESDVVALLVLGHQVRMHNLIARLHRRAGDGLPIDADVEDLVRYMLFVDEAPLNGTVTGSTTFATDFERLGPTDPAGRGLRQFDLRSRLFRYPCSYLIYSEAFRALPQVASQRVYARLADVLSGGDSSPAFARLSPDDRRAVAAILTATDPTFAAAVAQARTATSSSNR